MRRPFTLSAPALGALLVLLAAPAAAAAAQDPAPSGQDAPSNRELERRLDALTEQILDLQLPTASQPGDVEGPYGVGPAAAQVYGQEGRVSIGGYGEVLYENFDDEDDAGNPAGMSDQFDVLRTVLYVGYRFDETWVFNSEIEFEHGDEVGVEFAYVDGMFHEAFNLRMGHVLVPLGFVNEQHEPTTFWGGSRPEVEQFILPTTWHENGVGTYGEAGTLSWRGYVMNGFSDGFDLAANGLRGGRQKGSKAVAEDLALAGRLDWQPTTTLMVGGGAYTGDSGQDGGASDFGTTVVELHAEWAPGPWRFRGLYADATVDDAHLLPTPSPSDELLGWYVEGGYDLFAGRVEKQSLVPFLRYESYDLLDGTAADTAVDSVNVGLHYQPIPHLVLKANYVDRMTGNDSTVDSFELAVGWVF